VSIAGSQIYFETAGRSIEVSRSWLLQVARDILRGADEDEEVVKTSPRSDFSRDGIIVVIWAVIVDSSIGCSRGNSQLHQADLIIMKTYRWSQTCLSSRTSLL